MKYIQKILCVILILFSSYNLTSINLREKKRNNGFRVLMAKGYIDDISEFIMSFLKASKIQDNVKSLSTCINDLIKTFSSLAVVTQKLNDNPNLMSFMGVIGSFNQIYKDASNSLICRDSVGEFRTFLNTFINDPSIGKGDSTGYFKSLTDIIRSKYTRVYYELVRSANHFRNKEFSKAGEKVGDLFYNLIRLKDLSDDTKDFEGYSNIVSDESSFQNDASLFKRRFAFCQNSIEKILPDIVNFYSSNIKGVDVVPTVNDLLKSIFETNQLLQCFDGLSKSLDMLSNSNYNKGLYFKREREQKSRKVVKKEIKVEGVKETNSASTTTTKLSEITENK